MIGEFAEHTRVVSEVTLAPKGLFHRDQLPEDQEDLGLDMEVVHEVQLVNAQGEVITLHFDVPAAKDVNEVEQSYTNKKVKKASAGSGNQMKSGVFDQHHKSKGDDVQKLVEFTSNDAEANS